MSKRFVAITWTDGKQEQVILMDASADTVQSAHLFSTRMRENGWVPVKGSERLYVEEDGVKKPFIARVPMFNKRAWKVA